MSCSRVIVCCLLLIIHNEAVVSTHSAPTCLLVSELNDKCLPECILSRISRSLMFVCIYSEWSQWSLMFV